MEGPGLPIPRGLSPIPGWLTVEDAAARIDMDPCRLRDHAVLAGAPKSYGPFPDIADSAFSIFIDEAEVEAWDAAGRPLDRRWWVKAFPPPPPPPRQASSAEWIGLGPRPAAGAPLLTAAAILFALLAGYLYGIAS